MSHLRSLSNRVNLHCQSREPLLQGSAMFPSASRCAMGRIRASVTLLNPTAPALQGLEVSALADSGAVHLCIPEHLALQLQLRELERREVVLADGHRRSVPYMGPVEVRFANRRCFTGAMVLGDEVLLGAIPMEDMDLVLQPQLQQLTVNPASPNLPTSLAK